MSQRDLAEAVGVSTGSAHYLISALVERGFVKMGNFSASDDKRRYAYILTPKGIAEKGAITGKFLARKLEEYEALKREIEELKDELDLGKQSDARESRRKAEKRCDPFSF